MKDWIIGLVCAAPYAVLFYWLGLLWERRHQKDEHHRLAIMFCEASRNTFVLKDPPTEEEIANVERWLFQR